MVKLFIYRLVLYLTAVIIPILHPAVVVFQDRIGVILLFVLVPGELILGFLTVQRPKLGNLRYLMPPALWLLCMLLAGISREQILTYLAAATAAYFSSVLLYGFRIRLVSALEPFLFGYTAYTLLRFSRASEELAELSRTVTPVLLAVCAVGFILYAKVLYRTWFPTPEKRAHRRETLLVAAILLPVFLSVAFLLPPDFMEHSIVENLLNEQARPEFREIEGETDSPLEDGNLQSDRQDQGDPDEGEGQGRLKGLAAEDWARVQGNGQGEGDSGDSEQYAVMVVAAPRDSVYLADQYRGDFDSQAGFGILEEQPLNDMLHRTLMETWRNPALPFDRNRRSTEIFTLSTLRDRTLAYVPENVEPTVLNRTTYPFMYSFSASSRIASPGKERLSLTRELNDDEKREMEPWLSLPLNEEAAIRFGDHLDGLLEGDERYYQRIEKIMRSFSTCQYNIGFDEDVSVPRMLEFLFETQEGDCTEFSNTAAILGRLAGIPSRVVTGYLASRGLQTPQHMQGLQVLQGSIPILEEYPLDQLFLVTTAHRHSWVQYWLPDYGWIDFEATEFAIPPLPGGNFNNTDVVIPLLRELPVPAATFRFPWRLIGRMVLVLGLAVIVGFYLYKTVLITYLAGRANQNSAKGIQALYRLLLIRLAGRGFGLKGIGETAQDYALRYPELRDFAEIYSRMLYGKEDPYPQNLFSGLREKYRVILKNSGGFRAQAREILALRGLNY